MQLVNIMRLVCVKAMRIKKFTKSFKVLSVMRVMTLVRAALVPQFRAQVVEIRDG
jgi:hypothetical protein